MAEGARDAIEELLPAYALNALEPEERDLVERALEREPRYQALLAVYLSHPCGAQRRIAGAGAQRAGDRPAGHGSPPDCDLPDTAAVVGRRERSGEWRRHSSLLSWASAPSRSFSRGGSAILSGRWTRW